MKKILYSLIDSISIKVSSDANKNKNNQEQSVGVQKGV